jgi:hypothetical protein
MYVYIKSEPYLWTVGFYTPDGEWIAESDYDCKVCLSCTVQRNVEKRHH